MFDDIYADSINAFNKISLQKKMIENPKKEINNLNYALDSSKEVITSLVDEHFNIFDTIYY